MKIICDGCKYEWDFKAIKRKNPVDCTCPNCKASVKLRERVME